MYKINTQISQLQKSAKKKAEKFPSKKKRPEKTLKMIFLLH